MVAFSAELWFNEGMKKSEAIEILGGSVSAAAKAIGVSYQAVAKWPEVLSPKIADRVIAAHVRSGGALPKRFKNDKGPAHV